MLKCSTNQKKVLNSNKEIIIKEIQNIKETMNKLNEKLELLVKNLDNSNEEENNEKVFNKNDLIKMTNKEIEEIFLNNICRVDYQKQNGEYRVFDEFTFKKEYRTVGTGNFDYKNEISKFVFGIDLTNGGFKRLKPRNIISISIIE